MLTPEDLIRWDKALTEDKAQDLIDDGMAMAVQIAPCIEEEDFPHAAAAKAIMRAACLRWGSSGSGGAATEQRSAGSFSQSTTYQSAPRRSLFYPSEITALQDLCSDGKGKAFAVDTIPDMGPTCLPGCTYGIGSVTSPCRDCGLTRNPAWRSM